MMSLQVSLMASPSLVFGDDFSNRVTIDSDAIYLDRMEQLDCIVIGGGILGLSVARTIIEKNGSIRVAVLEKEDDWARHQSGRNSGVIHSGLYYKPGSLKAKLCREGNRRMVEFCDIHVSLTKFAGK
jgi:L-2-hydroxyglutarate oxidase LhgO